MRQLKITKSITNRSSEALDKYLLEIGKEELVSVEEEVELAQRIRQGDQRALEKLTKANLRFVVSVAKQYQNQGLSLQDLINEGNIGLIKAAQKFDETRGFKFISYAVWWVRQNITRAIAEKGRMVRISAEKELVLRRFNKKGGKFRQVVGGTYVLDTESLAGVSKYKGDAIEKVLMMDNRASSLDAPVGESGEMTLGDTLASDTPATDNVACDNERKDIFDLIHRVDPKAFVSMSNVEGVFGEGFDPIKK